MPAPALAVVRAGQHLANVALHGRIRIFRDEIANLTGIGQQTNVLYSSRIFPIVEAMKIFRFMLLTSLLGLEGVVGEDHDTSPIEGLASILEIKLKSDSEPLAKFDANYESHLKKLGAEVQRQGKLNLLLMATREMKSFRDPDVPRDYREFPRLMELRSVYDEKRPNILKAVVAQRENTLRLYAKKLAEMKLEFTKRGELGKALEVANEEERIATLRRDSAQPQPSNKGTPVWEMKSKDDWATAGGIIVDKQKVGWRLEKGDGINTRLGPKLALSPPFKVIARLTATTRSHVRFIYGGDFLVRLNVGESDNLSLRVPRTSTFAELPGRGKLTPGVPNDLEFQVRPASLRVLIDGDLKGELIGDFSKLNDQFTISPFRDCPVILERFEIWPLDGDQNLQKLAIADKSLSDIYAVCDNQFKMAVNGKIVAEGQGDRVQHVRLAIKDQDMITVRLTDAGSLYGFACVIKRPGAEPIASSRQTWRSYTPKDETNWMDASKVTASRRAGEGTNVAWKSRVEFDSGVPCESIWGHDGPNPGYLILKIED